MLILLRALIKSTKELLETNKLGIKYKRTRDENCTHNFLLNFLKLITACGLGRSILSLHTIPPTFKQNWIVQRAMIVEVFFLSDLAPFLCSIRVRITSCSQRWREQCFSDEQIEQLDGTDIMNSFNNNTNLDIGIENNNK